LRDLLFPSDSIHPGQNTIIVMKKIGSILKSLIDLPWLPVWLVPLVLFSPLLLTGRPMFWGAVFLQFTPWRVLAFDQILAGQLPLWNSFSGMGAPLMANYQSALFYPPTWLLLPFYMLGGAGGLAMGETWSVVLHLIWSGIGMVLLIRQLGCGRFAQVIAALAFSLSGYMVTRAGFLSINAALAWLPWVLLAAERLIDAPKPALKAFMGSGLVIGMLLLAGHAQTAFYTLLLAGCWVLFRQWHAGWKGILSGALFWGLSVLLGCGLAAIQLLPTAEYLAQSQRAVEIGYDYAVNYSFLPWRFLTLLLPNLFGTPADGTYLLKADAYWEDAVYIGLLPFFLGVAAMVLSLRKQRSSDKLRSRDLTVFLAVMSTIASLIALGSNAPIFPFLYKYIPTFDLFQAPARWMIWLVLALAIMAGFGADAWHKPGKRGRFWLNLSLALGFTMIIITLLAGYLAPELPRVFIKAFTIFGVSIVLACILAKTNPLPDENNGKRAVIWRWAVIGFVSVDLLLASWNFHQGADPSLYSRAAAAAQQVKTQTKGGRVYISADDLDQLQYDTFFNFRDFRMDGKWDALADVLLPNTNLYGGLASVNNFDPLLPGEYSQFMAALVETDKNTRLRLMRRIGVTSIEIPEDEGSGVRFEPLAGSRRYHWANCLVTAQDSKEALSKYIQYANVEGVIPQPVIVESPGAVGGRCSQEQAAITIIEDQPGRLSLNVMATSSGWLVVSDLYYPGWKVWVDDQSENLLQVDYLFRGIEVREGEHTIRMVYRPLSFYGGFGITVACVIVLLGLWVTEHWRKGKISPSSNV
jgi:hypothetical protein